MWPPAAACPRLVSSAAASRWVPASQQQRAPVWTAPAGQRAAALSMTQSGWGCHGPAGQERTRAQLLRNADSCECHCQHVVGSQPQPTAAPHCPTSNRKQASAGLRPAQSHHEGLYERAAPLCMLLHQLQLMRAAHQQRNVRRGTHCAAAAAKTHTRV